MPHPRRMNNMAGTSTPYEPGSRAAKGVSPVTAVRRKRKGTRVGPGRGHEVGAGRGEEVGWGRGRENAGDGGLGPENDLDVGVGRSGWDGREGNVGVATAGRLGARVTPVYSGLLQRRRATEW